MTRRALRTFLSSALLLTACTSRETPPEPAEKAAPETPETRAEDTPPPVVAAPEEASLSWVRANACEDGAPMSLTASDGTGLRLASLTARAVVEGPLAFTELRLAFDNPEDRQLEGRFAITLPPGAAISRFAMKIDERWQEGEVVERQAARVAYEDFLHRRQDPALLEKDAGNVFRARVFPIPARGRKELVLSYSQELAHQAEPYRLPLCGLPTLDLLDVDVAIVQGSAAADTSLGGTSTSVFHLDLRREAFAPTQDLEARVGTTVTQGLRHGDLAVARVVPVLEAPAQAITGLTILFDTSASRALDFGGQVKRLGELVAALPPEARIHVVAYDQQAASVYTGPAGGLGRAPLDALRQRGALGASNLAAALAALPGLGAVSPRLLLVGDGVVTAGASEAGELQEQLRGLTSAGLQRVDAIIDGGIQDEVMLAALTRAGLPHDGVVLDARQEVASLAERLGQATRSGVKVSVPGAEWVYPAVLDGIQPGAERLVYAQLPPEVPMKIELTGAGVRDPEPTLAMVAEPLLARAHAQARIADLTAQRDALSADETERRQDMARRIVELSTRHRVLSDLTALLVLETEADYARFGIDRRALADILVAGRAGVEAQQRVAPPEPKPEPEPQPDEPQWKGDDGEVEKKMKLEDGPAEESDRDEVGVAMNGAPVPSAEPTDDDAAFGGALGGPAGGPGGGEGDGDGSLGLIGQGRGGGGVGQAGAADLPVIQEEAVADAPPPPPEPPSTVEPDPELEPARARPSRRRMARRVSPSSVRPSPTPAPRETPPVADPYQGRMATVMEQLGRGDLAGAEREATAWRGEAPGDVLALVALGEVREAQARPADAARAYGSLIDLFPSRADLRRMAGERLERLGGEALALAIDTYAHGVEQRPDHPSSHRLYAYALLKAGRYADAFGALEASLDRSYPGGRFLGVQQVLREDLGLVGAAWIAAEPSALERVEASLLARGSTLATTAGTRFVLNWETDANDVDLHVYDAKGHHAYFSNKVMASGGQLYADVTTGYGPECFAIEGKRGAGPYTVMAHYYRRGPMGYGMGKLEVIEHDGAGHLRFGEHPFVIMKDDGYVKLAEVGARIEEPPAPGLAAAPTPDPATGDPTATVIYQAQ